MLVIGKAMISPFLRAERLVSPREFERYHSAVQGWRSRAMRSNRVEDSIALGRSDFGRDQGFYAVGAELSARAPGAT